MMLMKLLSCTLFALYAEAFLMHRYATKTVSIASGGPLAALKLKEIALPLQTDPSKYETLLHEVVAKTKIIRWYIARISNGKDVIIEAIIEE
jgi:hypothetical protein